MQIRQPGEPRPALYVRSSTGENYGYIKPATKASAIAWVRERVTSTHVGTWSRLTSTRTKNAGYRYVMSTGETLTFERV